MHQDPLLVNTFRPRQHRRHFADDFCTCIFLNKNGCILIKFSLNYVRKCPIDNNPALFQMMDWRQSGDKPLSEPMVISLPTHICVTRPQWVKSTIDTLKLRLRWRRSSIERSLGNLSVHESINCKQRINIYGSSGPKHAKRDTFGNPVQ